MPELLDIARLDRAGVITPAHSPERFYTILSISSPTVHGFSAMPDLTAGVVFAFPFSRPPRFGMILVFIFVLTGFSPRKSAVFGE